MVKVADLYLEVDPWAVIEKGFHPERARVSESIFSLGNEKMGVRGYFEEGCSGDSLPGSYFNGVYEETDICHPQIFKGLATRRCFMVNSVDWLYTRIVADGEQLDLNINSISSFERRLDLRQGTLTRSFQWELSNGKRLGVTFIRFLSMSEPDLGAQQIRLAHLDSDITVPCEVSMVVGLDFSPVYELMGENYWACPYKQSYDSGGAILGQTKTSGQYVFSAFHIAVTQPVTTHTIQDTQFIGLAFPLSLEPGTSVIMDKLVLNTVEKKTALSPDMVWQKGLLLWPHFDKWTWRSALEQNRAYWQAVWETSDIEIEGDPINQQGVRFCVYQLHQTYHGVDASLNVGAKGLTGEVYYGWTFWDTETYCLPFYLFSNPQAARNLLGYRYTTLPQAIERAHQLDCQGARYPMGTIDGTESVGTWQHGDLEIHVSAAVSYGIWHYIKVTGDSKFLHHPGIEMLIQICRFFASRGGWSPQTGEYGFWGVMGPDEFHMMVHNNTYTNLLAKKTFEWTLDALSVMRWSAPAELAAVTEKLSLSEDELKDWAIKAEKMRILYNEKTKLYEQHDGYFDMPEVDVKSIPPEQFPIYKNWAYDSIFRINMLKQPDVLLFLFFFSQEFDLDTKRVNYDYYEPRCSHESSLSPGIHAILASELGKHEIAYEYALHAARLDLDNYNRNTHEGLHTTSMAAAWLLIVYGFGGMRSDGEVLVFKPTIPPSWQTYTFRLVYRERLLRIKVNRDFVHLQVIAGTDLTVKVYEQLHTVTNEGIAIPLSVTRC